MSITFRVGIELEPIEVDLYLIREFLPHLWERVLAKKRFVNVSDDFPTDFVYDLPEVSVLHFQLICSKFASQSITDTYYYLYDGTSSTHTTVTNKSYTLHNPGERREFTRMPRNTKFFTLKINSIEVLMNTIHSRELYHVIEMLNKLITVCVCIYDPETDKETKYYFPNTDMIFNFTFPDSQLSNIFYDASFQTTTEKHKTNNSDPKSLSSQNISTNIKSQFFISYGFKAVLGYRGYTYDETLIIKKVKDVKIHFEETIEIVKPKFEI